jgi:hypothetical protein
VKKEDLTINVPLAQMDHISITENVEIAQMDIGQMMLQILVMFVILHVNYVMEVLTMIVPNVILPMDSISRMMDNVFDPVSTSA